MLAFTTQQLTGGARYGAGAKIGNWNEDLARQEVAAKDYAHRRAAGQLLSSRKASERAFLSQPVTLSYSRDHVVSYGDTVMLQWHGGAAPYFAASNIFSQTTPGHTRVTASAVTEPQARSTFVITRPSGAAAASSDNTVRYGQRICFASNPLLHIMDPATGTVGLQFLLASQWGSAVKGRQECTATQTRSANTEWTVTPASGDMLVAEGNPVFAGDKITLVHAMSGTPLAASQSETYPTDFGVELELYCAAFKPTGHSAMKYTGEMPLRASQPGNVFSLVLSSEPTESSSASLKPLTPASLIDTARAAIAAASGLHGIRSLSLAFASLDARGSGSIPADGVKWALYDHGATLADAEFAMLLQPFTRGTAFLHSSELLSALRGVFSEDRQLIVESAYAHLQKVLGGAPTLAALKAKFDAKWDPRVVSKRMTVAEAGAEFARQWFQPRTADVITSAMFADYYRDVSACVADDYDFLHLVANSWHLPGQGSWRGLLSKRVQITFHAGSSTEVVVPNAEHIGDDDFEAWVGALRKLGFGGIARIHVLGIVEPE